MRITKEVYISRLQRLVDLTFDYCTKVIDFTMQSEINKSLLNQVNEMKKKLQERTKTKTIQEFIDLLCKEEEILLTNINIFNDYKEVFHARRLLRFISLGVYEIILWNKFPKDKFFEYTKMFYSEYIVNFQQLPISDFSELEIYVKEYKKYALSLKELKKLQETDIKMSLKEVFDYVLNFSKGLAKKMGGTLPESFNTIKLKYVNWTIGMHDEADNALYINEEIAKKEPLFVAVIIFHEIGHHFHNGFVKQLNINPLFKIRHREMDNTASTSDGIAINFTELAIESLKNKNKEAYEKLIRFHRYELYYFALRGYAAFMVGSRAWDEKKFLKIMDKLTGDKKRSKIELMNMKINMGYKEGYIVGYEKLHKFENFEKVLKKGFVSLDALSPRKYVF